MTSRFAFTVAVIVAVLVLAVMPLSIGYAQQQPPRPRPDRDLPLENLAHLPSTDEAAPARVESPALVPGDMAGWSKFVFQSLRGGTWDIFVANGDWSNQIQLTNWSSAETYPRLNRGNTRLAFSSNRTGNYEIYTMNLDGSGVTQLTFNTTNDYNPNWSPDGTKIAFSTYRDGQSEIYVMNADGSAQTRLTVNSAYDGQPSWSPDGSKLAFASDRSGLDRIWVMNADGSGAVMLSTLNYSENPNWSPDGSQIAFDADYDGDGFQELIVMNADGNNQHMVFNPSGQSDVWARSWSPNGQYVAATLIQFVYYQGQWYWTTAYPYAADVNDSYNNVLLSSQGEDWYPGWQTSDVQPPAVSFTAAPSFLRCWNASLAWSGYDASGISGYDVQSRLNGGAWSNWLIQTTATTGNFSGPCGASASFRVRAQDNSSNRSAWSSPLTTTLYSYRATDFIVDNRGFPLSTAALTVAPAPAAPVTSYLDGYYDAYLQLTGTHAITAVQTGYGLAAPKFFSATADLSITQALPSEDNVIQNGSFEDGLIGWQTAGLLTPTLAASAAYAGNAGLSMGQGPGNLPAANLLRPGISGNWIQAAYDPGGTLHLVWNKNDQLMYTNCSTNTCQLEQAVPNGSVSNAPRIAIGSDGIVHVVWQMAPNSLMYASRSLAGVWSTPEVIAGIAMVIDDGLGLAVDASNRPHVIYSNNYLRHTYRQIGGSWTTPELVGQIWGQVSLAFDNSGTLHLVTAAGGTPVRYVALTAGGTWSAPYALSEDQYYYKPVSLAVDAGGIVHVVWAEGSSWSSQIYYVSRALDGTWSSVTAIPNAQGNFPQLTARFDGLLVLIWDSHQLAYRQADGVWSNPRSALDYNDPGGAAALVAHPSSPELAVASIQPGVLTLYATRLHINLEQSGQALAEQNITVPADSHQPTLSFFYKFVSEDMPQNDCLILQLSDGVTTTAVTLETSDWKHSWFDLSDWLGKTVTVTIGLSTTANGHFSQAFIDEISVGSWLTPIPVAVQPQRVRAGQSVVMTITGQNFIGTTSGEPYAIRLNDTQLPDAHWIDSTTLTATAPYSMPFGTYDVFVTNPGRQTGTLSNGLLIGERVYLPVMHK